MYIERCFKLSCDAGEGYALTISLQSAVLGSFYVDTLPSFGTYITHIGSDVHVISVPVCRGQAHVNQEPSMSRLSVALALVHFLRRVS